MKPLASYSIDSRSDPLIATLGLGEASRALMPCTVFSRASSTRRGRTWVETLRLKDTPVTSLGRLKLCTLVLAATELGITTVLPWLVSRWVARQSISTTLPSVPSMAIQSSS
ncbi:hypothetical protein D9M71_628940 [compost metagenome]